MATSRTLNRLPRQGKIFGVCAGLADYFELDVTLLRVIFVILTFVTGGAFFLLYLVMAIVMPVSNESGSFKSAKAKTGNTIHDLGAELRGNDGVRNLRNYLGLGLLVMGVWLLLGQFFPTWLAFRWDFVWPVILIFAGVVMITRRR